MGTFNVNTSEFGRSATGKREAINKFNQTIDAQKKVVFGEKYNTLISTISANWVGDDAEAYKKLIKTKATELSNKLDSYKKLFENAMNDDSNEFSKVTQKNASTIKNIR